MTNDSTPCEDEGCPHYGTSHSHAPSTVSTAMTDEERAAILQRIDEFTEAALAAGPEFCRAYIQKLTDGFPPEAFTPSTQSETTEERERLSERLLVEARSIENAAQYSMRWVAGPKLAALIREAADLLDQQGERNAHLERVNAWWAKEHGKVLELLDAAEAALDEREEEEVARLQLYNFEEGHKRLTAAQAELARVKEARKQEEDYYPSHESLHAIICLLDEYDALNGGGPGWRERWDKERDRATQLVGRDEP